MRCAEYLHDQRDNLVGIFFIITLIFSVLVALLIRNNFRRMQNELDIIAAWTSGEGLGQENFREFYNLSSSFNKIINRYKELENTRQEFVSNVSHELKTPITSMKILADSLLMQPDVPVELYEEFMNDIVHEIVVRIRLLRFAHFSEDGQDTGRFKYYFCKNQ